MAKKDNLWQKLVAFFFEVGTMRKILRSHRQTLLTDDLSDNIASHSFRVVLIGWFLAKLEKANPYKVAVMCLLHDLEESRVVAVERGVYREENTRGKINQRC